MLVIVAENVPPRLRGRLAIWLLEVRAVRLDQGGRVRAALRRGWLVRWGRNPGDSVASRGVLSRYEVDGFE